MPNSLPILHKMACPPSPLVFVAQVRSFDAAGPAEELQRHPQRREDAATRPNVLSRSNLRRPTIFIHRLFRSSRNTPERKGRKQSDPTGYWCTYNGTPDTPKYPRHFQSTQAPEGRSERPFLERCLSEKPLSDRYPLDLIEHCAFRSQDRYAHM